MADVTRYRIRDWEEVFLTAKTRGREGRLRTVQVPVKLDDPDYVRIATRKDGAAVLGVWLALIELAGTRNVRDGRIARKDGRPLSTKEISDVVRIGESVVSRSIGVLSEVGWLVSESCGTIRNDSEKVSLSLGESSLGEVRLGKESRNAADAAWFAACWNETATTLPSIQSMGDARKKALKGFWRDAGGSKDLIHRAIAAFASWDFAIEKQLGVDTFLRANKRDKYLEFAKNGPPKAHGTAEHSAETAQNWLQRRFDARNLD